MTKYLNDKTKGTPVDTGAPISVPNYDQIATESREERYCPYCQLRLSKLIDSSGMNPNWYCSKCTTSYPTKADSKSKSVISTPRKSNNENPRVAFPPEVTLGKKKTTIKGGLAEIAKKGSIRITSYTESKG